MIYGDCMKAIDAPAIIAHEMPESTKIQNVALIAENTRTNRRLNQKPKTGYLMQSTKK